MAKRYIRLNWQDKPATATPISAANLNKMDKGIDDIDKALDALETSIVGQIVNDPSKINNAAVNYSLKQSIDALNNKLAQENWIAPTLLNDWTNFGGAFADAGYYKDGFDVVHLRGIIKGGQIGSSAFQLPIGYRPANTLHFPATSNSAFGSIQVSSNGVVTILAGSSNWVSLAGISFRVD